MIPLVAPHISDRDHAYLWKRIDEGLLENETEVRRFEEAFAERVGCEWAVAVCSGTTALALAVEELNGLIVSMPTYGCVALRNATPRSSIQFLDSRFDIASATLTLEPPERPGRLAIIVHGFGTSTYRLGDPREWGDVIEDWTLSLGSLAPLIGKLGVCSTHESKMISTGRGGVVFGDGSLEQPVRELVERSGLAMSSTQAALGVSQLAQLDQFIERRRELAHQYSERFQAAGIECPDPDCGSVFFRYLIGVNDPAAKVEALAERGIEAGRGVYPPLHRLDEFPDDDFPGATECVNRLLSVPVHPSITDEQASHIIESVLATCSP